MSLRFGELYTDGYYHIFNRGTEKRQIFNNQKDYERFLLLLELLNSSVSIKSMSHLFMGDFNKKREEIYEAQPLVEIYAYAVLPNHFHLVLKQISDNGVSTFMRKLGMSYANYFNTKYDRNGSLFQGAYKYVEIDSDAQLMRLVCYVNNNYEIHKINNNYNISLTSKKIYETGESSTISTPLELLKGPHYQRVAGGVTDQVLHERNIGENFLEEL